MNTSYFLRVNKHGEPVLYARVYANRSDYSDFSLKFISNNLDDFKTQQRIKAVDEKLQEIITKCLRDGTCSARIIKETYQREIESASRTMRDLFNYWIENQQRRVKWNEIREVTLKRHRATQAHLNMFLNKPGMNRSLGLLDVEWLRKLESYLKDRVGTNTSLTHIKHVRRAVLFAVENKWIAQYPFMSYKAKWKVVDRGYLTQEQLDNLCQWNTAITRLEQVRDVFVFQCYTGISHSDLTDLTFDDSKETITGVRNKTRRLYMVPILPKAREILEKYAYKLPLASNQKMNQYLKEIAVVLGIDQHLTTHLARHTFATTVLLENRIPLEVVARMLGHNSVRSTEVYGRVLKSQVLQAGELLNTRYQN